MPDVTKLPDIGSLIIKEGCFEKEDRLFMGVANLCHVASDTYHAFIDCDDVLLRNILNTLDRDRYKRMGTWLILNTSPWHFSLANFARIDWHEYVTLLSEFPLAHEGYVHYTLQKGYGVLRLGAKYGIAPKLMYRISNEPLGFTYCAQCYRQMFHVWNKLKQAR